MIAFECPLNPALGAPQGAGLADVSWSQRILPTPVGSNPVLLTGREAGSNGICYVVQARALLGLSRCVVSIQQATRKVGSNGNNESGTSACKADRASSTQHPSPDVESLQLHCPVPLAGPSQDGQLAQHIVTTNRFQHRAVPYCTCTGQYWRHL